MERMVVRKCILQVQDREWLYITIPTYTEKIGLLQRSFADPCVQRVDVDGARLRDLVPIVPDDADAWFIGRKDRRCNNNRRDEQQKNISRVSHFRSPSHLSSFKYSSPIKQSCGRDLNE